MNRLIKSSLLAAAIVGLVSGCGGGSGTVNSSGTLSGKAAVGSPIVNAAVNVVCAGGTNLSTTTDSTGAWTVAIAGQTFPCAVEVSRGTINAVANATAYHSVATSLGVVNVTPLTDLLVANLVRANPNTWFSGLNASAFGAVNATTIGAALTQVRAALPALAALATTDPITQAFTAASGNAIDDMLTALARALLNSSVSYASLLSAAAAPTITPPAGLASALTTAYAGTTSGSGFTLGSANAGCTGAVAAFFVGNARTATATITTYNATPNATPTVLGVFVNGATMPVTVNANCSIAVGAYTLTSVDGSFLFANSQYDVDMASAFVAHGHFEKFANGTSLLGFSNPANTDAVQFSLP